jgi:7-cyano-7-deazaguanine synthase
MKNANELVLLSGGIDSSTLLALAKNRQTGVEALHISYGQPAHRAELRAATNICEKSGVSLTHIEYQGCESGAGEIRGRNAFLLAVALLEFRAHAGTVLIGIHGGTGYVDCSAEFVAQQQAIYCLHTNGAINLEAPFLDFSKQDILRLATDLGVDLSATYSCESGDSPCGVCQSCIDRALLIPEVPVARS